MSPKGLSTLCFAASRAPRTGTDQVDVESPSDEVRRPDFGDVFMQDPLDVAVGAVCQHGSLVCLDLGTGWSDRQGSQDINEGRTQSMNIGIDSYCFHRFFGEVYDGQPASERPMTMEDFLAFARELEVAGVSLESCFFPTMEASWFRQIEGPA